MRPRLGRLGQLARYVSRKMLPYWLSITFWSVIFKKIEAYSI